MRASSKCPKVESSSVAPPPPPPSLGDPAIDEFIDSTVVNASPPFALDVASILRTLDTIITVQLAYGQLLVDVLTELQALRADLASLRWSPPPPSFDDE